MVRSLLGIFLAVLLLCGAAVFETRYVDAQFSDFGGEIETLAQKVEGERAAPSDAEAVRRSWETRKSSLHVWIPHNDISRVDDILAEAAGLIAEENFPLAAAKLEVLRSICRTVPGTYRPLLENIF